MHVELNLGKKTVNQVISQSQITATITFEDANQDDMSKESQGEKMGKSNSDVQVKYCLNYKIFFIDFY